LRKVLQAWKAVVDARLTALGTEGLYLVSDRAKALIQLAEQGLECLCMPDFFHVVHDLIQCSSLALGRRLRHAQQEYAGDGTTPAVRFFRQSFPDLFETVVSHIEALPRPQQRKHDVTL
jgi:hypothetical protein